MAAGLAGAAWLDTVLKTGRSAGCALNGVLKGAITGVLNGGLNGMFSSELGGASGLPDDGAIRMPPRSSVDSAEA
jgi:hypothetical protein